VTDSQAIAVRRSTDIAQVEELEQALRTGVAPDVEKVDAEQQARELVEQLLSAETDEELERPEAEGWSNFVGVPFEVQSFVWRPSSFEDGQPVFLVVRAIDLRDGRLRVLTTGSAQSMAQLVNRAKRGSLPAVLELKSATAKESGNTVYWLATPEAVAEQRRQEALEEAKAAEAAADAAGEATDAASA